MSEKNYLSNLEYKDLYTTIINNKDLFNSKLDEYWIRVADWQKSSFGGKKITNFSTLGTLGEWDDEEYDHPLNARTLIDGSPLKKFAFAWFCSADLINSTKYFSKNDFKGSFEKRAWGLGSTGDFIRDTDWSLLSLTSLAKSISKVEKDWSTRRYTDRIDSIESEINMDFINSVLPKGFSEFAFLSKNNKDSIKISSIKNKMDFMIWKKFLFSKKMTETHLRECIYIHSSSEFLPMLWSQVIKIDDVMDKKYFKEIWRKTDIYSPVNASPEFALMILEKNRAWSQLFFRINLLENIDFSDSKISPLNFFNYKEVQDAINDIGWERDQSGKNHFFTKDAFIEHLKKLWDI